MAADPHSPGTVYVSSNLGLRVSHDGGDTWTQVSGAGRGRLAVDPDTSGALYAVDVVYTGNAIGGYDWQLYRSTDAGVSLQLLHTFLGPVLDVAPPVAGEPLLAAEDLVGVEVSDDGGDSWRTATAGLHATGATAIALSPAEPSTVHAAVLDPLLSMRSPDGGIHWPSTQLAFSFGAATRIVAHPTDPERAFVLYPGGFNAYGTVTSEVANLTVTPVTPVFDLSADYSLASNPNGAWSYGWEVGLDSALHLLEYSSTFHADNGVPIAAWQYNAATGPVVNRVKGPGTAVSKGGAFVGPERYGHFAPGSVGTDRNFGVVRFTSPASGEYRVETVALPLFDGELSADCDFHLVLNGQELFGQYLGPNEGTGYTNQLSLSSGDTLDWAIGRGTDGSLQTGLKLAVRVVQLGVGVEPPQIVVQPQSQSVAVGGNVTFAVEATGVEPLSYQWWFNENPVPEATNPVLELRQVPTQAGDYWVTVANEVGSVTSHVASLTVTEPRVLVAADPPDAVQGQLVSIPLVLTSPGDVSGMTFVLRYDPAYLSMPEVVWALGLEDAFREVNSGGQGEVRCVFALPQATMPAGVVAVAAVNFRARTVLEEVTTHVAVEVLDVSGLDGQPLSGADGQGAQVRIQGGGNMLADNNANGRIDIGDATLLMRLLAQLDSTRDWDIPRNDLNQSGALDSGDTIKLLRIVAGTDPYPEPIMLAALPMEGDGGPSIFTVAAEGGMPTTGQAVLSPDRIRGLPGEQVTVQVRLERLTISAGWGAVYVALSGAGLAVGGNPAISHRLPGAGQRRGGVERCSQTPAAGDSSVGQVTLAVSSATPWTTQEGVLAELTFDVLAPATEQYLWPVVLSEVETTASGYERLAMAGSAMELVGHEARPAQLSLPALENGQFRLSISGDMGASYQLEMSTNLVDWLPLRTVVIDADSVPIVDADAGQNGRRFYRAVPLE